MGRTPEPEPPPDPPPAPAIDHLFDGAADPAADEPDLDLAADERRDVCEGRKTHPHRRSS
jgi:hypothetical protein